MEAAFKSARGSDHPRKPVTALLQRLCRAESKPGSGAGQTVAACVEAGGQTHISVTLYARDLPTTRACPLAATRTKELGSGARKGELCDLRIRAPASEASWPVALRLR
jgi:hypothetical protein